MRYRAFLLNLEQCSGRSDQDADLHLAAILELVVDRGTDVTVVLGPSAVGQQVAAVGEASDIESHEPHFLARHTVPFVDVAVIIAYSKYP